MKIEVMVDKDNTHFSYNFDCDKVIDGSRSRVAGGGADDNAKLVILKKTGKKEDLVNGLGQKVGKQDTMETIAVFNTWTFWRIIIEDKEKCEAAMKCENCGKSLGEGKGDSHDGDLLCRVCHEKKHHKVCQNCGKPYRDGGDTLCQKCLDGMTDAS